MEVKPEVKPDGKPDTSIIKSHELCQGDQIAVIGEKFGFEYFHHGIFINLAEGVIDFGWGKITKMQVKTLDLFDFIMDEDRKMKSLLRVTYQPGIELKGEEVVERAKKLKDNPESLGSYNVLHNNCEHLATYCKIGNRRSQQIEDLLKNKFNSPKEFLRYCAAQGTACVSSSSLCYAPEKNESKMTATAETPQTAHSADQTNKPV